MLRLACGCVAIWSAFAVLGYAGQSVPPSAYEQLVNRYLGGSHVGAVLDLLGMSATEAARYGQAELERVNTQHARPTRRGVTKQVAAAPSIAQLDERIRAIAALHLEAAVAAPQRSETTRRLHLRTAELALDSLEEAQARWAALPSRDELDKVGTTAFRHSWFVVGLTHLQRVGAVADALRLTDGALDEFPEDDDFWVIRGSLYEQLATFGVTLDADRARVYPGVRSEDVPGSALAAARAAFERARRLDPDNGDARIHLARVVGLEGDARLAEQLLAGSADSPRLEYLSELLSGGIAEDLRQFDRAAVHFRRAAGVLPDSRAACIGLAYSLAMNGRSTEARSVLRPCLTSHTAADDPWLRYSMGLEWLFEPAIHALRARVRVATAAP